ncbi:hypothetical protein GRF29_19g1749588 [Pseudopithomyces chartarum]|uniref:Gfd2/YDR514C-like C-terminal domain-containing protein n=1 Tax=Pseudopithomyces chartarum TaxID=1892770 RepID=A0AAN6RIW1_9PLEO|nr:hypothetical protein GRF29_19g1749588 [Pseudopithomyces chartarum]
MAKTSLQKLEKLRGCAWTQQQCLLLQSYLQAQNLPSGGTVELNRLFKKAVLVTLYCNRMSFVPYKPLDLGIATLQEYAHLPASTADPDAFHFGTSVFASKEELKYFLTQIWQQPIDEEKPELGFRPIVCLEYGNGSGSVSAAMWKEIGFDPAKMDNTIAMLDGQVIAEQAKITRNQFATIDYLLAQFQISPHACDHAGNTAAYVIIVAMLCALRKHLYQSTQNEKSKPGQHGQSTSVAAQVVVNRLMERPTPAPPTGVEIYCHRCGSHEHKFRQCINTDFICNGCLLSPVSWKRDNAASHKEGLCIFRPRFFH